MTLAFGEIIGRVAVNCDDGVFGIGHFNLTNGRAGITPVDKIDLPLVERVHHAEPQTVVLDGARARR